VPFIQELNPVFWVIGGVIVLISIFSYLKGRFYGK